jgi:hypothetical protein
MSTAVVANWKYSRMVPPPPWRDVQTLEGIFRRLSSPQRLAMDRLVAQDGKACGIARAPLYALLRRELMVEVVSLHNNGWRLCGTQRCGEYHRWFHIPPEVAEAYTAWSAAWEG